MSNAEDTELEWRRKGGIAYKGYTQASLARELGVTRSLVNGVLRGKMRSPRIERAIAEICGEPVDALFPPRQQQHAA